MPDLLSDVAWGLLKMAAMVAGVWGLGWAVWEVERGVAVRPEVTITGFAGVCVGGLGLAKLYHPEPWCLPWWCSWVSMLASPSARIPRAPWQNGAFAGLIVVMGAGLLLAGWRGRGVPPSGEAGGPRP